MRAMLIQQGLASALTSEGKEDKEKEDLDKKGVQKRVEIEAKAHSAIVLCLGDKVLREVAKEKTAADILKKLEDLYLTKSLANRLLMKQRLYSYRFLEGRGILEQLEDFNKTVDDLENIDVSIGDEDKAILLLNALPPSYDQLRDAILYGREKTITLLEVQSAMRSKELQKGDSKLGDSTSESLNVKKFKGKRQFKKPNDNLKASSSDQKETRSCHWCKKPGHLKRDCYAWKRKQESSGGKVVNSAEEVEEDGSPEALNVMETKEGGSWIMDSGCSFHMCPNLSWFDDIKETSGSVILGNNQICYVKGIGTVRLKVEGGCTVILNGVRYIPEVKRNLISLGSLEQKGCKFVSEGGKMIVSRAEKVLMVAERRGSLYYMTATVQRSSGELHTVAGSVNLWHVRLGHPAAGSVKELIKKGVLQCSDEDGAIQCEECILGKAKKLPYPRGTHSSTMPLDYAHSDLWGPAQEDSIGGGKYYMSIIDDFSRKIWIYILKQKSEAFNKFKDWCMEVEAEKGMNLKCLRTDNGLEFLSREFDVFCRSKGIRRHKTVPMNPQQNGVAERVNRTILERVRCMLLAAGMEKRFWAEAAATAVKLINKCPSSSIGGDTPDYRWYGRHSNYDILRTFGCKVFAHVKQGKLEARALKCVMIGYQRGVKGYRLWCVEPGNAKVIISRDVTFWEDDLPFKKKADVVTEASKFEVEAEEIVQKQQDEQNGEQQGGATPDADKHGDRQGGVATDADIDAPQSDQQTQIEPGSYKLARDRVRRVIKPPAKYSDAEFLFFALLVAEEVEYSDPSTYEEAMDCKEWEKWMKAMVEEIDSLLRNGTWVLVERPDGRRVVSCKWIFKKKLEGADSENVRFKARLVARGFTQEHGVDYDEVFSPVVKHTSIRILLAIVARRDWELEQLDVKTAFLHGDLKETLYMAQPKGFVKAGDEGKVCLLKKSIYGLKQASRQWHRKFDDHVIKSGFLRSAYDECVYIKSVGGAVVAYLLLYVDDMLLAGACPKEIQKVKLDLKKAFEMKDLGPAKRILGMTIIRNRKKKEIWLTQTDYVLRLLKRFQMSNVKEVSVPMSQQYKLSADQKPKCKAEEEEMKHIPYANIIGSIMYAMIGTRPDIAQAISVTSRYMSNHGKEHWSALKWLMRYLKGASDVGILFKGDAEFKGDALTGWCDSDFAGNIDTRRSQSGFLFSLYGSIISWKSSLQGVVALSTTEAEFMAMTSAVKEGKWLKGILEDFGIKQEGVSIGCDNNSALSLAKHQVYHERSKHIDVRLHFIREEIEKGSVRVFKVDTAENPADMLTKPVPKEKLDVCMKLVNLCKRSSVSS